MKAYNVAHALFSSTAPLIQTSLVTTFKLSYNGSTYHSWSDSRIFPAYYLVTIALLSLWASTYGISWCRKSKSSIIEPKIIGFS